MAYYIKNIWGPGGQEGYPWNNQMGFAEGQRKAAERFSQCEGFLIYETGHCRSNKCGAKAIFAKGIIDSPGVLLNKDTNEYGENIGVVARVFLYAVKINLSILINPLNGVSIYTIRKIIGKPKETMQRPGGLVKITEEQFNALCLELDKAKNNGKKQ